ncbi:MAG: sugar phosphate nucleotidyltransferase [Vicinamibacterales bacterium]
MKAVILAGGLGTRMGDATAALPKPLVQVGGRPILWHILKGYQAHGISDFIVCAGHAGHRLCEFFEQERGAEPWTVQVVDTGLHTATGGRLRRVRHLLGDETFCMTYGDAVADVDVTALLALHRAQHRLVTVTAVQPRLHFGVIAFGADGHPVGFQEKPRLDDMWVNGGFFVIEPAALDAVTSDEQAWEDAPMTGLARAGQLAAYRHGGFWQCMDAPRDRDTLERIWQAGDARWKVW